MARSKIATKTETAVLTKSARRCTLCFYLFGDLTEKLGQIAHLDQASSNRQEDNLAFMCLEHHTLYDSKTRQHKNYTMAEVKTARASLYAAIANKEHLKPGPVQVRARRRKPRVHVVFNPQQCVWGIGGLGQPDGKLKKVMSVHFWGIFSNDSDREPIVILEAFPEGTEQQMASFQPVIPPRGRPVRVMISAIVLPILGTPGQQLETRFILKDQFGRVYKTTKKSFRWASSGIENLPD